MVLKEAGAKRVTLSVLARKSIFIARKISLRSLFNIMRTGNTSLHVAETHVFSIFSERELSPVRLSVVCNARPPYSSG